MDSQGEGFAKQFRSAYPNLSISVKENGSGNVKQSLEKQSPIRTPQKAVIGQKASVAVSVKPPAVVKTAANSPKTPVTNLNVKQAANLAPKINTPNQVKAAASAKPQIASKTPVGPRPTAQVITKGNVVTPASPLKTSVPNHQVAKSDNAVVKSTVVKTSVPSPVVKANSQKVAPSKVVQNPIKTPVKSQAAKEDTPDQSTTTVVYMQQPAQRANNQLTIEKIDQQQRIPVVLDSNQVVVRSGPALVLQNPQLQSVVIGTSSIPASAVVGPQVEITTSEPLQALQVTQQVTLYGPKGQSFAVDDVKKQINLKQSLSSTMTNVVSSTTNPVPVRTQEGIQSPVRVSNKVSAMVRGLQKQTQAAPQQSTAAPVQYSSTRGQIKKVSPKREIPMQKVSPLPPSVPPPPPDMILANEEEVTTSEEVPTQQPTPTSLENVQLIVILPNGEKKEITVPNNTLNVTLNELIGSITPTQPDMTAIMTVTEQGAFQSTDCNSENPGGEPGEILGIQDEVEAGDINGDANEQSMEDDFLAKDFPPKTEPLYREGLLAVCQFCGYTSIDFNHCQRCSRKIPPNCKTVSAEFTQSAVSKGRKTKADSLSGGSPKKKRVCRKKKPEEPVCLTISDDEELLGLSHHHQVESEESFHSDSNSQMSSCDKEPIITDEMVSELKQSISGGEFIGGGLDVDQLLDNSTPALKTTMQCRTVRIGSYKVVPKDKVLITSNGIKVTVPMVGSSQIVDIKILHHEIIKVLTHFGRGCPVLFLYTRPAAAARVRKTLQMHDKNGYYYDCMSSDETHRRITFLPDKIDEDCKAILKEIYKYPENLFAELTGKEANDILVKASPKEVQKFLIKKQPAPVQPQVPFNGQNIQTIMVYPPPPEKGGIPINTEDYACLDCDQFLNDVIIDFYLKYVVEKTLSPEDRARTHVFSSFFYKRLTTKPPPKRKSMNPVENDPTASPAVKRHSRVKSWTKNVNLFTKDFIIIPINENSHWFLAIVCFPGLTGPVRFSDNTPIELPGRKKKKIDDKVALSGKQTMTIGSTTITAVAPSQGVASVELGDEVEDRDEADGEDEHMDVPDEEEDPTLRAVPEIKEELEEEEVKPKKKEREPIKQPCILIFDSLAGASRSRVVATLRDYLRVEYEAKHGETRDFSGEVLKGTNVRCPQQTNYTDCGLYVLQYVEAFFKWPITDYHIPILQVQNWFQADIVTRKRYDIQQLLLHLMEEQRIDIETLGLPVLNLSPDMGSHQYVSEEDDEDDDEHMGEEEEDEDEMLGEDGEYNEEIDHEHVMEEGQIGMVHHEDEEDYLDATMEHEDHDMDEEEFEEQLCEEEEEDPGMEELEDDKMTDESLSQLKKYRIPRLTEKDRLL